MKKLALLVWCISSMLASTYTLQKGWNLIGANSSIENMQPFNAVEVEMLWMFKDKNWHFYSKNENLNALASSSNFPIIQNIQSEYGFWVYTSNALTIEIPSNNSTLALREYDTGWNLASLPTSLTQVDLLTQLDLPVTFMWKYGQNGWQGFSSIEVNKANFESSNIEQFSTLNQNEGFWIYLNEKKYPFKLSMSESSQYSAKFVTLLNDEISYLENVNIYDAITHEIVATTDSYANAILPKTGTYYAKIKGYEEIKFYKSNEGIEVIFAQPHKNSQDFVYADFFDIGNWYFSPQNTAIEAKVAPKIFFDFNQNFALQVNYFFANQDLTLALVENTTSQNTNNENLIASMDIVLQNSNGENLNMQEVTFVGEFVPMYTPSNTLDPSKAYALYIKEENQSSWKFLQPATLDRKNRLKATQSVNTIGSYAFFAFDKLNTLNGVVKNTQGEYLDEFYVIQDNFSSEHFTQGIFNFLHSDAKELTIFADGYESKKVLVSQLNEEIILTQSTKPQINAPKIIQLDSYQSSVNYSDVVLFQNYFVTVSSKGVIEVFDSITLEKVKTVQLPLEFVFDSIYVNENKMYIATLGGSIYQLNSNFEYEELYSSNSSWVCKNDGFVYKPLLYNNLLYFGGNNGCVVILGEFGLEKEWLLSSSDTMMNNSINPLIFTEENIIATTFAGESFNVSKDEKIKLDDISQNSYPYYSSITPDEKIIALEILGSELNYEAEALEEIIDIFFQDEKMFVFFKSGEYLRYDINLKATKYYDTKLESVKVTQLEGYFFIKTKNGELYAVDISE